MGDPLSPGTTIGTCAWMEREWMNGLHPDSHKYFRAARYMDDILMITRGPSAWDEQTFLKDFTKSECYWEPLKLEEGAQDTFLESRFHIANGRLTFRLKNENETTTKIWRYHHYYSALPHASKRAMVMSALWKVHNMASDDASLYESAIHKLNEFVTLRYPLGILRYFCAVLARDTSNLTWRRIRSTL